MTKAYSKKALQSKVKQVFEDQHALISATESYELPQNMVTWFSKLSVLKGLPFNYLVPEESMLPENSIRFFYLDPNWVDALVDGAFSIGRNLTDRGSLDSALDAVLRPKVGASVTSYLTQNYVNDFKHPTTSKTKTVTGFLLRSSVVKDYPNMGVNAYPAGHAPSDNSPTKLELLPILRYEQLGDSDVLLCLIQGEAYQIDLHQAPEVLHLAVDCYNDKCKIGTTKVNAIKNIRTFTVSGNDVTITSVDGVPTDISSDFRTNAPRVFNMTSLSKTIAKVNNISGVDAINSAEMGFVMTEGVGTVSFISKTSKS